MCQDAAVSVAGREVFSARGNIGGEDEKLCGDYKGDASLSVCLWFSKEIGGRRCAVVKAQVDRSDPTSDGIVQAVFEEARLSANGVWMLRCVQSRRRRALSKVARGAVDIMNYLNRFDCTF